MKRHNVLIGFVLTAMVFVLLACEPDTTETVTPQTQPPPVDVTETPAFELTEVPLPAGYGAHDTWIDIYFTDPESPLASQETGGPDGPLAASIDSARLTLDVAIYSMSLRSIRDALIRAHERGVQVRVVMESDNMDGSAPQALIDAGIELEQSEPVVSSTNISVEDFERVLELCYRVRVTLEEQSVGWKERSVFERQWMIRSFRKQAGMPVEKWLEVLERLGEALANRDMDSVSAIQAPFNLLAGFYVNLYEMAKGYIKDANQREEQLGIVQGWHEDVENLASLLKR